MTSIDSLLSSTLTFVYRFLVTAGAILVTPTDFFDRIRTQRDERYLDEHAFFSVCVLLYAGALFNLDVHIAEFFDNLIDPSLGEKILYVLPLGMVTYGLVYGVAFLLNLPDGFSDPFRRFSLYWWGASLVLSAIMIVGLFFVLDRGNAETTAGHDQYYLGSLVFVSVVLGIQSWRSLSATFTTWNALKWKFLCVCLFAATASVLSVLCVWGEAHAITHATKTSAPATLSIYNFGKEDDEASSTALFVDTVQLNDVTARIAYYLRNETGTTIYVNARKGTVVRAGNTQFVFQFQYSDPKFPLLAIKPGEVLALSGVCKAPPDEFTQQIVPGLHYNVVVSYATSQSFNDSMTASFEMDIVRQ